ncbi:MAG TPA: hypothetical protein DCK98_16385 [Chloroflexi bacterium]|jgi:hypothetical protein|nr:hypothetical protein [Chloroflexota bacterium]HAL26023.1 hypothetical protein [Chloroflexota bacterium]
MFWKKREDRRLFDAGFVGSPLRGVDVDIEECMACGKLLHVLDDDPPYVVCTAWRTDPRTSASSVLR